MLGVTAKWVSEIIVFTAYKCIMLWLAIQIDKINNADIEIVWKWKMIEGTFL